MTGARRWRVGVTGHRRYDAERDARAAVTRVLAAVADQHGSGLEVWSSLAEGADRMVVEVVRAIDPGARLVAVLPLPADDYRNDFAEAASRAEFDRMLGSADATHVVGPDEAGSRESAYARAGLAVSAAVDVLIAVWDGAPARGPGGTAEIVAAARAAGREVAVIPVTRAAAAS